MGDIISGYFNNYRKNSPFCSVIIPSAGKGTRMGLDFNKLFLTINEKPILAYTIEAFEACPLVDEIIIVSTEADIMICQDIISDFGFQKVVKIVAGGNTRQESVYNGIKETNDKSQLVLIHDGARPLILQDTIEAVISKASETGAAAPGIIPKDTVKLVKNNIIYETLDRESLFLIQTPQGFRKDIIKMAHENAKTSDFVSTDDCMLVEKTGTPVSVITGSHENIKLTTPEDYAYIEFIINDNI